MAPIPLAELVVGTDYIVVERPHVAGELPGFVLTRRLLRKTATDAMFEQPAGGEGPARSADAHDFYAVGDPEAPLPPAPRAPPVPLEARGGIFYGSNEGPVLPARGAFAQPPELPIPPEASFYNLFRSIPSREYLLYPTFEEYIPRICQETIDGQLTRGRPVLFQVTHTRGIALVVSLCLILGKVRNGYHCICLDMENRNNVNIRTMPFEELQPEFNNYIHIYTCPYNPDALRDHLLRAPSANGTGGGELYRQGHDEFMEGHQEMIRRNAALAASALSMGGAGSAAALTEKGGSTRRSRKSRRNRKSRRSRKSRRN